MCSATSREFLIASLLAATSFACGPTAGGAEALGQSQAAISQGSIDTTDTFAGAVLFPNVLGFGSYSQLVCSGSLVSPRVFLTAGHCTHAFAAYNISPSQLSVSLAVNAFSDRSPIGVASYVTAPGFAITGGDKPDTNDLGVVILAHAVNNVPVAVLPPLGYLDQAIGNKVDWNVVGSGLNSEMVLTGYRMQTTMTLYSLADTTIKLSPAPGAFCAGDSGGPTTPLSGTRYVVSQHSSVNGTVSLYSKGNSFCNSTDYDTRLDVAWAQQFIQSQIAANP